MPAHVGLLLILASNLALGASPSPRPFKPPPPPTGAKGMPWRPTTVAPSFNVIRNVPIQAPVAPAAPAPVMAAPTGPGKPTSDDEAVDEIAKQRAAVQAAYEGINTTNPMSGSFDPAAGATGATGPLAQMQKMLSNPMVQGYLKFFQNPVLLEAATKVSQSPNRMTLLYAELGFVVFMLFFRAWRQSKATHWMRKIWVSAYTFVLGVAGTSFALPALIIGDPYVTMMTTLLNSAFQKQ